MITHDGSAHPMVAISEPKKPPAVYPVKEAALSAIGPGVISDIYRYLFNQRERAVTAAEAERAYHDKV